ILIDPAGSIVDIMPEYPIFNALDDHITETIKKFDATGKLDRGPLKIGPERADTPASPLAFPGKVLADQASGRLLIADSNHNRVVVLSLLDNSVEAVVGSGEIGMKDGGFEEAAFNHPQGMALDGSILYVADTENHVIRAVDFEAGKVITVAGTGERGLERRFDISGPALRTALSSPWDLAVHDGGLYIAMAGTHQIWKMDLQTKQVGAYAGTGHEARIDGPLAAAALAQPSGLTTDGKKLYFADSEVSCIRSADFGSGGEVETIAGGDLFDYGDRDEAGRHARFQHPLDVAHHEGVIYVADTYNNKIKRVSLKDRSVETFVGTGEAGLEDGDEAKFHEPGGLSIAGGRVYIADTNNHVIRAADLKTGRVETLQISGLERPSVGVKPADAETALPVQSVCPGGITLKIALELPAGYKLNPEAPSWVKITSSEKRVLSPGGAQSQTLHNPSFPISIPLEASVGKANLRVDMALHYCGEKPGGGCHLDEAHLDLPVEVDKESNNSRLQVSHTVPAP
ncbi:MAG: hypothetical protein GTO55_08165, partial [Armatimonadetes bacterium]|nr:hypothetical protein [Armatimonadota bacterium]NIM24224.1 hypothetical protein [Armatimonadota bacterium]NIM68093.1 hypothetical protein [Armatimonadota bacterium]NIM76555.1 hypothetical protein [Armatimonadota bacterium]NIN06298.1 hypothetical protein [Armatimonadota bacterium]